MWGIVPAAGRGTRIQPLAFSKELLPVGSRTDQSGAERPCAVSEYLVERMILGGADKICFIISPGKSDILEYFGAAYRGARIAYVVQQQPAGLCDAIFQAAALIGSEPVVVGLPDTVWFPESGLAQLPDDLLSFLLFPVDRPEFFDAVVVDDDGRVSEIQVKSPMARSNWIWGAFKMPGSVFHDLHRLWRAPDRGDEYFGTLVNAYLAAGGRAVGVKGGRSYVDVGTLNGYRAAIRLLGGDGREVPAGAPQGPSREAVQAEMEEQSR
ncbi:MAG: nucleotidyltransferase family protein [Gemmatimonas sp.]